MKFAVGQSVRGCRSTGDWQAGVVITCVVHYVIDPTKSGAFERFARRWMELVDKHGLDGIAYTPRRDDAVATVDRGAADVAFLLRGLRVDEIFDLARGGERMPTKSTYFFPKPLSGLLFHPLDR